LLLLEVDSAKSEIETSKVKRAAVAFLFCFACIGHLEAASADELAQRKRVAQIEAIEVPFDQLSHKAISGYGQAALKIDEKKWRHAESDHFIIHYQLWDVKNRLIREAEFYYWKVQNDLKLTQDLVDHKSHLFVFQDDDHWRLFQASTGQRGLAGVTIQNEFFSYYPKKKDEEFSGTVAHEMTHLVFNRFFTGRPPLWLNEGFAEYQAHKAYQSLFGKRYPGSNKDTTLINKLNFLEMTSWTGYNKNADLNQAFYAKSQVAVELLADKGGPEKLVEFIKTMIQNPDFKAAFDRHYSADFKGVDKFLKELARREKRL
jgi:hypothetical protein